MREWCVLTVDLKKLSASSALLAGRRGRAITPVENVVFFARTDDLAGLADQSQDGAVVVYEYDVVRDQLQPRRVGRSDLSAAGEIYHAHPSLITARVKLVELDGAGGG